MKTIGIIGAMEVEVAILKEKMEDVRIIKKASMDFYEGILAGKKVVVVRSGIGKVNAGICAQILADVFSVDAIINTGIAGSLNKNINIGDIVLSTDVVQHDMDATGFGYRKGQIPQMPVFFFNADDNLRIFRYLKEELLLETSLSAIRMLRIELYQSFQHMRLKWKVQPLDRQHT